MERGKYHDNHGGRDTTMARRHAIAIALVLSGLGGFGCKSEQLARNMEETGAAESIFVGQKAPDFTLQDQDGQTVTLSRLEPQWVVLFFYPKDDTPSSTYQAKDFTRLLPDFHLLGATVVGVSPNDPVTHRAFIAKHGLGIRLLSDPDRRVLQHYGAWMEGAIGLRRYGRVLRSTFIIDPHGIIRYHWPEVFPYGHADRVKTKLTQLKRTG